MPLPTPISDRSEPGRPPSLRAPLLLFAILRNGLLEMPVVAGLKRALLCRSSLSRSSIASIRSSLLVGVLNLTKLSQSLLHFK